MPDMKTSGADGLSPGDWSGGIVSASTPAFNDEPRLGAMECCFSTSNRRKLRSGVFKSVAYLEAGIERRIRRHNKTSKPFQW
jgi:hypothetical protein